MLRGRAAAIGLLPVISAGCGYAWTGIASKLLTDELAAGALLVALVWLATAAASEGLALLSEMSALQRRPATHVAPMMFAVQVLVPVALAPLIFGESWAGTPLGGLALVAFMAIAVAGTVLLAGSRAVGAVIENAHADETDRPASRRRYGPVSSDCAGSLATAFCEPTSLTRPAEGEPSHTHLRSHRRACRDNPA